MTTPPYQASYDTDEADAIAAAAEKEREQQTVPGRLVVHTTCPACKASFIVEVPKP